MLQYKGTKDYFNIRFRNTMNSQSTLSQPKYFQYMSICGLTWITKRNQPYPDSFCCIRYAFK